MSGDTLGPNLRLALPPLVVRRSLIAALVVGTVSSSVSQGDALLVGEDIDWLEAAFTHCVPLLVATDGGCGAIPRRG